MLAAGGEVLADDDAGLSGLADLLARVPNRGNNAPQDERSDCNNRNHHPQGEACTEFARIHCFLSIEKEGARRKLFPGAANLFSSVGGTIIRFVVEGALPFATRGTQSPFGKFQKMFDDPRYRKEQIFLYIVAPALVLVTVIVLAVLFVMKDRQEARNDALPSNSQYSSISR